MSYDMVHTGNFGDIAGAQTLNEFCDNLNFFRKYYSTVYPDGLGTWQLLFYVCTVYSKFISLMDKFLFQF